MAKSWFFEIVSADVLHTNYVIFMNQEWEIINTGESVIWRNNVTKIQNSKEILNGKFFYK